MAGPVIDRGSNAEGAESLADRPSLGGDFDARIGTADRAAAARRRLGRLPSSSAVTAKKRTSEMIALIEAERLLAKTNQSNVRVVALEIAQTPDPSTAVTAVHRAIELDYFSPPSVQVTVVMNETIALERPAQSDTTSANAAEMPPASVSPETRGGASVTPRIVAAPSVSAQALRPDRSRSQERGRRALAALLFIAIMAGATALLLAAVSRGGMGPAPQKIVRDTLQHLR